MPEVGGWRGHPALLTPTVPSRPSPRTRRSRRGRLGGGRPGLRCWPPLGTFDLGPARQPAVRPPPPRLFFVYRPGAVLGQEACT